MSNHLLLVSQKIVVGEVLSCEDVPELTFMFVRLTLAKKKPVKSFVVPQNVRAGIKVMVALPGARIADNYKIKKGKNPWFRVTWDDLFAWRIGNF